MARFVSLFSALVAVLVIVSAGYAGGKCEGTDPAQPAYVPPADETARAADAAYAKGLRAMMEKRLDDAAGCFEETIKLDPKSYNTHLQLAKIYRIQDKDADAERVYRHAIEVNPKAPAAYESLMIMLTVQGRGKDAAEAGGSALAAGVPDEALPTLGWSYYLAGDKEKAGEYFGKNLGYRPDDYVANRDMGVYCYESGRMEEAAAYFEKADKANPKDPIIAFLRAAAYKAQGDEANIRKAVREGVLRDKLFRSNIGPYHKMTLPYSEVPDLIKYLYSLKDKPDIPYGEHRNTEPEGAETGAE